MRLIKAQNTNRRSIYAKGIKYDINEQVIVDSNNSILMSRGPESTRPTTPINGHMRYNTDVDEVEFYVDGQWRNVRYKEPISFGIIIQDLGNGDGNATIFGPLDSQDTNPLLKAPPNPQNILVTVDNVFQIAVVNYDLVINPYPPSTAGTGAEIDDGNFVLSEEYIITDIGTTTDWNVVGGLGSPSVGDTFTAQGNSGGDGQARLVGTYLIFASSIPLNQPVRATHNLDK